MNGKFAITNPIKFQQKLNALEEYGIAKVLILDTILVPHIERSTVREFDSSLPMDALSSYTIKSVTNVTAYLCKVIDIKHDSGKWWSEVADLDRYNETLRNLPNITLKPEQLCNIIE